MTMSDDILDRTCSILSRPGAWLEPSGDGYHVRPSADRRRRPILSINATIFAELSRDPGLKLHGRGYRLARPRAASATSPGRPGVIEGERMVAESDGRLVARKANLGESPLAWLARRKGPDGKPWLTRAEVAAAERLREEFDRAGTVGRLTMNWDGRPSAGSGSSPRIDPAERARSARDRIAAALDAVGPGLREILERICLMGSALESAERDLGLPRRSGKTLLKLATSRLAAHYGYV